jgi:hypothetical protein
MGRSLLVKLLVKDWRKIHSILNLGKYVKTHLFNSSIIIPNKLFKQNYNFSALMLKRVEQIPAYQLSVAV